MESLYSLIKTECFQAPRWVQLGLQAYYYGSLSWLITCAEDSVDPFTTEVTIEDLLNHADHEFTKWPTCLFETHHTRLLQLKLTLDELNTVFEQLEDVFQDSIPTDIVIYSTLIHGNELSEEQWDRLYDALAFTNPLPPPEHKRPIKTRRTHGRRAVTPLRRRKAFTRHHHQTVLVRKI